MAVVSNTTVLNGALATRQAIRAMAGAVAGGDIVLSAGRSLTADVLKTVTALTPRQRNTNREPPTQRRGGRPLYKDWKSTVHTAIRGKLFEASVTNEVVRDPEGFLIMYSLEYGAGPHDMPRVGDKVYSWNDSGLRSKFLGRSTTDDGRIRDSFLRGREASRGDVVYRRIRHPGHEAFAMVRRTEALMNPVAATLGELILKRFEQVWMGRATVGRGS